MSDIVFRAGPCLDIFGAEPDDSFDCFVSDWPAGVAFMGRAWDRSHGGRDAWVAAWSEVAALMLRKAKPGAYSLTWALPRTQHWTATALEDGGWFIQDVVQHVFGQGWPKGRSALKPASECWILARKGSGGALQIDAARVARGDGVPVMAKVTPDRRSEPGAMNGAGRTATGELMPGSWPPNFVLSHCESCEERGTRRVKGEKPREIQGTAEVGFGGGSPGCGRTVGGDALGLETVPAFDCLAACDCGASVLAASGGDPPRCACGRAMWWCCPVAIMDAQSGQSASTTHARGSGGFWGAATSERGVVGPADSGGASRFFPRFSPDILAKHGTMSGTQEVPTSCEHASFAGQTSPRSGESNGSADTSAAACTSPASGGKSEWCDSSASDAAQDSTPTPATSEGSVPSHAQTPPQPRRARRVKSAAIPSASRETASAPSGAACPCARDPGSPHGADSTGEHRRPILSPCHAHGAARPEPIGTTTTTTSPRMSSGFAPVATSTSITSASHVALVSAPISLPSRSFYTPKAAGGERHAGCDGLLWRADKRLPFGFARIGQAEYDALDSGTHETIRAGRNEYQQPARARGNVHPTVKSLALMEWLVSLVCPPGGRVGDVTCGSGGTGLAVERLNVSRSLGASFLGSDICPEAIEIAEARFAWWRANTSVQTGLFGESTVIEAEAKRPAPLKEKSAPTAPAADPRQRSFFEP